MSHIGVNLGFGNLHENLTDQQMYAGEVQIAERHYEMAGEHFAQTGGYERYAETAALLRQVGLQAAAEAAASVALFGTPDELLRQVADIKDVLGDFQLIVIPSFGGLPYDQAAASLELFAKEVMPGARELQG